jgi:hypothetical protein
MENENNKILIQSNSCSVRNVLCIMYDPCRTCTQQTKFGIAAMLYYV